MGCSGYRFTWSNKRSIPSTIEERLDYVLVNDVWGSIWPIIEVTHLPRHHSDHNPIVLSCGFNKRDDFRNRKHLFRFEEVWLQDGEECAEIVAEA